jgi:HEXXH motif-containing protein
VTQPDQLANGDQLWFPGLAADLVARFEIGHKNRQVLVSDYGTHRWLTADPAAPSVKVGAFQLGLHATAIELLPAATATIFTPLMLADIDLLRSSAQLQAAAKVLSAVEGLEESVGRLVRVVHLLEAPPGHDVSHSSPDLPFSIFVSMPGRGERDISLRLAESILHESMHLQLTLIDLVNPIITDEPSAAYSPWKDEVRPVSGLLHGLYVFAVIHQAFDWLQSRRPEWSPYCRQRRVTIANEVATLPERPRGLSSFGTDLWEQCRRSVLAAR